MLSPLCLNWSTNKGVLVTQNVNVALQRHNKKQDVARKWNYRKTNFSNQTFSKIHFQLVIVKVKVEAKGYLLIFQKILYLSYKLI